MKTLINKQNYRKSLAGLLVLCLFTFVSFPVLIHVYHDASTGEHIMDFHQNLANHFHTDTHIDNHIADDLADDMHVIDGETSFIIKKLSDIDSHSIVAILCVLLLLPLLQHATGRVTGISAHLVPLRSHFYTPPLRAPPVHS